MKGKRKTQKGITLIALIITIIILLILAMVSIRLVMNQGILDKAKESTSDYKQAEEKEQIALAYQEYQMAKMQREENPSLTVPGATVTGNETEGWKITFEETGNVYNVDENGEIKGSVVSNEGPGGTLTNEEKAEKVNKAIGQTVEYSDREDNKNSKGWRVFYASEDEMFLISANIAETQIIIDHISEDDNSTDVFSPKTAEKGSSCTYKNVTYGAKYNSKWKIKLEEAGKTDNSVQSQVTKYLCDPKNWEKYVSKDAPDGTYAVGGSTLELLSLSWESSGHDAGWSSDINDDVSDGGYKLGKPKGLREGNPIKQDILGGLYNFGRDFWLASPADYYGDYMLRIFSEGYVSGQHTDKSYNSSVGNIRPIVSIPISNVQIGEDEKVTIR